MSNNPLKESSFPYKSDNCPYHCAFCYTKSPELVKELDNDINEIQEQVIHIQENAASDQSLKPILASLEEALQTINRASAKSKELTAEVVLPSDETMAVHLVPSHLLERLEEYRSDENKVFLLIGAFSGAILGILANWATNEVLTITRFSIILMGIFFSLAILSIAWAVLISYRASKIKKTLFRT